MTMAQVAHNGGAHYFFSLNDQVSHSNSDLVYDIWQAILSIPGAFTATELLDLQFTSRNFLTAIRPLIFQHINLIDEDRGWAFVEAVTSFNFDSTISTQYTRTFQLSFSPSGSQNKKTRFWSLFGDALKSMNNLKSLNLCFAHGDQTFTERLARLIPQLSDTVYKLHLLPIPEETLLSVSSPHPSDARVDLHAYTQQTFLASLSGGPWNDHRWPQVVGNLGPIRSLVITTPTDLIWPPHDERGEQIIQRWTSHAQHPSSLNRISFYFAYLAGESSHGLGERQNTETGADCSESQVLVSSTLLELMKLCATC